MRLPDGTEASTTACGNIVLEQRGGLVYLEHADLEDLVRFIRTVQGERLRRDSNPQRRRSRIARSSH